MPPPLSFVFSAAEQSGANYAPTPKGMRHPPSPNPRLHLWLRQENRGTSRANSPPDHLSLPGNCLSLHLHAAPHRKTGNRAAPGASITISSLDIVWRLPIEMRNRLP